MLLKKENNYLDAKLQQEYERKFAKLLLGKYDTPLADIVYLIDLAKAAGSDSKTLYSIAKEYSKPCHLAKRIEEFGFYVVKALSKIAEGESAAALLHKASEYGKAKSEIFETFKNALGSALPEFKLRAYTILLAELAEERGVNPKALAEIAQRCAKSYDWKEDVSAKWLRGDLDDSGKVEPALISNVLKGVLNFPYEANAVKVLKYNHI